MNNRFINSLLAMVLLGSNIFGAAIIKNDVDSFELIDAVKNNDFYGAKRLIETGFYKDVIKTKGGQLITCAAIKGNKKIVELLLASGVDVNAVDGDGNTALIWASYKGDIEIVKLLLGAKADISILNRDGNSALNRATQREMGPVVELLLKSANSTDNGSLMLAVKNNDENTLKILLSAGIDVNQKNEDGTTPLIEAANLNNINIVKILLVANADINTTDRSNNTALLKAVSKNNKEMAQLLLEHNADINVSSSKSETALILAIKNNKEEMVRFLLNNKADINLNPTILLYAINMPEMLKLLIYEGVEIDSKYFSSVMKHWENKLEKVKKYLDCRAAGNTDGVVSIIYSEFNSRELFGSTDDKLARSEDFDRSFKKLETVSNQVTALLRDEQTRRESIINRRLAAIKKIIFEQSCGKVIPVIIFIILKYTDEKYIDIPTSEKWATDLDINNVVLESQATGSEQLQIESDITYNITKKRRVAPEEKKS